MRWLVAGALDGLVEVWRLESGGRSQGHCWMKIGESSEWPDALRQRTTRLFEEHTSWKEDDWVETGSIEQHGDDHRSRALDVVGVQQVGLIGWKHGARAWAESGMPTLVL